MEGTGVVTVKVAPKILFKAVVYSEGNIRLLSLVIYSIDRRF